MHTRRRISPASRSEELLASICVEHQPKAWKQRVLLEPPPSVGHPADGRSGGSIDAGAAGNDDDLGRPVVATCGSEFELGHHRPSRHVAHLSASPPLPEATPEVSHGPAQHRVGPTTQQHPSPRHIGVIDPGRGRPRAVSSPRHRFPPFPCPVCHPQSRRTRPCRSRSPVHDGGRSMPGRHVGADVILPRSGAASRDLDRVHHHHRGRNGTGRPRRDLRLGLLPTVPARSVQ